MGCGDGFQPLLALLPNGRDAVATYCNATSRDAVATYCNATIHFTISMVPFLTPSV